MLINLKMNVVALAITGMIMTATITAPLTKIFGKNYNNSRDFSCCKGDKLLVHHYYTFNVLWVEVTNGYTEEVTGQSEHGGCIIRCQQ